MSGNGGNLHSLRDLPGTYEKSGLDAAGSVVITAVRREIEAKVTDILRRLSPLNVR